MSIDFAQLYYHDCNSHIHQQPCLPQQIIYINSGYNSNASGIQTNGKIDIDYCKICNVYCSCEKFKFEPDEVQFEFSDIEEFGKSIPGAENNKLNQNSGLIEDQQIFNLKTGNNHNKCGTQISGSINFHFLQVYNVYYSCLKLKDMLDKAKSEFTDIESVRQIPDAENIILLKKSGMFCGKQMFDFSTGNNHNESGTQKSGGINFSFEQVHNTYYSRHNSKDIVGEAKFDIQTEKWIPEVVNVLLEDTTDQGMD